MARKKGAKDITPRKKARILALKNVQELTAMEIARQEGVCRNSVIAVRLDNVSPEVIRMAEEYERDLIIYARATALKAQKLAYERLDELNALQSTVVAEKNLKILHNYESKTLKNNTRKA